MEISTIHSELAKGIVRRFYIFSGVEWKVQRIYIEQISKVAEIPYKYIDSLKDVYAGMTSSLLTQNYVYVVRDDNELLTNEKLQSKIKSGIGKNVVVLLLTHLDKRKKFYTEFKDNIFEFEPLKPNILKKYLKREVNMTDEELDILMEVCEYDYGRCSLEIDKINRYLDSIDKTRDDYSHGKGMRDLLKDGTIYIPPRDAVFMFVDAVLRKQKKMFELLKESKESGEATLVLLSVLYKNAKQVLQVQSCKSNDIAKSTGLSEWQVRNAKDKVGNWKNSELIHLMRLCQKVEKYIKIGKIDEHIAVEYVLLNTL